MNLPPQQPAPLIDPMIRIQEHLKHTLPSFRALLSAPPTHPFFVGNPLVDPSLDLSSLSAQIEEAKRISDPSETMSQVLKQMNKAKLMGSFFQQWKLGVVQNYLKKDCKIV